jgi:uncharacterized protein YndB with AHSA1/START domain
MSNRTPDGVLTANADGGATVSFEWYYDRPVEAVWAALTEPDRLSLWLADAEVDLRMGGRYRLLWRGEGQGTMEGTIVELEPPRVLAYTWNEHGQLESTVRWELATEGEGCVLRLTHTFPPGQEPVPFLGGWHDFLYALLAGVDGYRTAYDPGREKEIDAHYRATLAR